MDYTVRYKMGKAYHRAVLHHQTTLLVPQTLYLHFLKILLLHLVLRQDWAGRYA